MKPPYTAWLDNDLVVLAKTGQSEAFAELVRRTRPRLMKSALSVLNSEDEAEDQVQNAFEAAKSRLTRARRELRRRHADCVTFGAGQSPLGYSSSINR